MIMIARRVVPQIGFATTMTRTGRDFGSGRENPFGLETGYCSCHLAFFRHGGMERACISPVYLVLYICTRLVRHPHRAHSLYTVLYSQTSEPSTWANAARKAKKVEVERKPTELTESNLLWQDASANQHNNHIRCQFHIR